MSDDRIQLGTIAQVALPVTNLERAIAFYRDQLGLNLLFQVPNLAFFDCGGVRLMLDASPAPAEHRGSIIYFKVPDANIAHDGLVAAGVIFERDPQLVAKMPESGTEVWMAFFRDPDRNLLAIMAEKYAVPV
jgi:catechol 2,3-dioxygenase-like lactoylglutathione lyase family enzyme